MNHLLDFQNVEKENLEKIINSILKINLQKLKKYMASDKKVKDGKLNLILIDKKFHTKF